MCIAIYHPWLKERGGAEKVVLEHAKRSEFDVEILTLYYDPEETFDDFQDLDVKVLGSNRLPKNFLAKGIQFGLGSALRKIETEDYEHLIVSEAGLGSLITLRNHDISITGYIHTPLRPALTEFRETYRNERRFIFRPFFDLGVKVYNFLEKNAWNYFDRVVANSKLTKKRILEKGLTEEEKIDILHPGANIEQNENQGYKKYFLYPTRFRRYKRQELAIQAFQEAELPEEFELVLAGDAQEEDYVEELKELAEGNVRVETDVSKIRWSNLYANCYTVLFCAENEDWGIIPIEAGSYSKPTISVNEGGPQESIIEGETGYLVEPKPEAFAEKMELLATDFSLVEEMGKKAEKEVQKYSWKKFAQKLDSHVEDLK